MRARFPFRVNSFLSVAVESGTANSRTNHRVKEPGFEVAAALPRVCKFIEPRFRNPMDATQAFVPSSQLSIPFEMKNKIHRRDNNCDQPPDFCFIARRSFFQRLLSQRRGGCEDGNYFIQANFARRRGRRRRSGKGAANFALGASGQETTLYGGGCVSASLDGPKAVSSGTWLAVDPLKGVKKRKGSEDMR